VFNMVNPGPIHPLSPDDWLLSEVDQLTPTWSLAERDDDADLAEWRSGLSSALERALGLDGIEAVDRDVKLLDRSAANGVTVERILYNSERGVTVPALLLLPHVEELPQPAVIVCMGGRPGKSSALLSPSSGDGGPDETLVRRLLDEGLIVVVPDMVASGERRAEELPQVAVGAWLGRPLVGRWVHDARCAIDVLAERQEIDSARLGIVGIGPVGAAALHAMALDERLRVGAVAGQLASYADRVRTLCARSWEGLRGELHAMVPGGLCLAELHDVAALCAPRPLLMCHAPGDAACAIDAARKCAEQIRVGYGRLGGKGLFQAGFLPEMGTRLNETVREFLTRHLRAQYV
jgi:hypothetical protein